MSKSKKEQDKPYQGKGAGKSKEEMRNEGSPPVHEHGDNEGGEISIGLPISKEEYDRLKKKAKQKDKKDE